MDANASKKCVLLKTKNGHLKDVLNILDGGYDQFNTEEAVKIIICVCNACVDNAAQTRFTADEVAELVVNCMKAIEKLDNNSLYSFLASIFHVVKYFINKGACKCIIHLQVDLIRILKNNQDVADINKSISNIDKIIYNGMLTKLTNSNLKDLAQLCQFSIVILQQVKELSSLLHENILSYMKNFNYLQLRIDCQCNFYLYVIGLVEEEINETNAVIYLNAVLSLLYVLLRNCLKDQKVIKAKEMIVVTMKLLDKLDNKHFKDLTAIVENIMELMCSEDEFPTNLKSILTTIHENYEKLYIEKKFLQTVDQFSKLLYIILQHAKLTFRTFSKTFWSNFSIENIIIISKFTIHMAVCLSWVRVKCETCEECMLRNDYDSAVIMSLFPVYILRYCITNGNKGNIDEILWETNKSFELASVMVQRVQEFKCNGWKNMWMELGTLAYNLSIVLHRINHKKDIFYGNYFIKKMILFEGVKETVLKEDILHSALLNLTECYINQCDNKKAMLIAAFNIFLHPDKGKSAFWQWIRIKSNNKEDEKLQNFNLTSIMDYNEAMVKSLHSHFKITIEQKIHLLQFELKQYKNFWYSKMSVVGAFHELHSLSDTLTTIQGFVSTWGDGDNEIPVDMHDIIFENVEKFEKMLLDDPNNVDFKFYMAFLYLIQYYVAARKVQQKNREDMQATRIETTETQFLTDKNDECDLVTWYESLKIENHSSIMNYLKKSFSIFKDLIHEKNKTHLEAMKVYITLNKLANEYLLQSYTLEYIEAWLCCLRVARILNDKICIIESIGYLLEKSNLNSKFIKEALSEASDLITQVGKDEMYREGENSIRKWIVLINFYISRGVANLKNGDANTAIKFYNKAWCIYDKQEELRKYKLLTIRFEFFEWKLQLLPCSFKFHGHGSALSKPHFLIDAVTAYYKENANNTYVLCILFQIFTSVVHMYRWIRQPREVRCYGREIMVLAQELIIPFKAIQLLSYLADADLLSVRMNDCCVKIDGICDILGHSRDKTMLIYATGDKKLIQNEMNTITNQFQEMMLDFPAPKRYQESTSGSPILLKDSFKIPSFLEHEEYCECFCCLSLDFQELVLVRIALQASLCYYEKNLEASTEYFQGALCVYRKILTNEKSFQKKVEKALNTSLFPSIEWKLKEIYCVILLGLGYTLVNTEKFLSVNAELIGIVKKSPYFNTYLYSEALFQQLNYLCVKSKESSTKSPHLSPVIDDNPSGASVTTPENKCSQVSLTSTYTPVSETKKKVRKVIKFDLSDIEEKPNPTIKKPVTSMTSYLTQTPAVSMSKIKVYRPASVKSNRKKKVAGKLDFTSERKENIEVKFEFPEKPKGVETKLRTRTKMLTEKLKKENSTIPSIVVTNDSDTEHCSKNENNRPRTRAKKNLMAELGCEQNNAASASFKTNSNTNTNNNKGAIKKPTHSRKMI